LFRGKEEIGSKEHEKEREQQVKRKLKLGGGGGAFLWGNKFLEVQGEGGLPLTEGEQKKD